MMGDQVRALPPGLCQLHEVGEINMMNTMGKKSLRVMAGLALCLGLQACDYLPVGYVKVEDVARNPANFEGREVKLKGVVKNTWRLSSVDTKAYLLGEGGATVTVTTTGDLPREGDIIAIRGKVSSLAILGGVGLGTTVQETEKLPALVTKWPGV
jgi:hypothetical protein